LKRVVLDTNTLSSGLLWDGNESMVIEKAEKKEIKLFISYQMLEELEGVLKRKKFSKKLEGKEYTVEKAVAKIALIATLIEPNVDIDIIKEDPDDNKVLECAVSARATVIVSGDSHLLNLNNYAGIQIISTVDFIKQISR
jgi:putative PIN family toxin of toxin-antitoxin system